MSKVIVTYDKGHDVTKWRYAVETEYTSGGWYRPGYQKTEYKYRRAAKMVAWWRSLWLERTYRVVEL